MAKRKARWIKPLTPVLDRAMTRIQKQENGCWLWIGPVSKFGYGYMTRGRASQGPGQVHRLVYEAIKGHCPKILHHTCHNQLCVNPDHMAECASHTQHVKLHEAERVRDGTPFRCGHPRTAGNTLWQTGGPIKGKRYPRCRKCRTSQARALYYSNKEKQDIKFRSP